MANISKIEDTLRISIAGLTLLTEAAPEMTAVLSETLKIITQMQGRLIVTGLGKSGHIAAKLAATFSSTGTPAYFLHPAEASHGDLGMVQPTDVILALS